MPRTTRRVLFVVGGGVALLVLAALAVPLAVDADRLKARLEAAASDALGMEVRIAGRLGVGLLPAPNAALDDGRILDEQGTAVVSVKRVRLWIALLPLLRGEFRLRRIELAQPRLALERDSAGRLNVEPLRSAAALLGALDGASVALSGGSLGYVDRRSGKRFEATGVELEVARMRLAPGRGPEATKGLALRAKLACAELRTKDLTLSALEATLAGKDAVFLLEPVTLRVFGGRASGSLRADVSGPVPSYRVRCSLPRFRIEEFLRTRSPERAVEGSMDFTASLSMQGRTRRQLVRSAAGEFSLRGVDLTLVGNDLDLALSRFESSQSFSLVDVGAVFLAGPLGLAVTKGYDFAGLLRGPGGTSEIRALVSDWRVERGVARATDVALATRRNRLALQGGLDLVDERFADVTVAVVDARGCATVRQAVRGPFAKPVVEKPRVLASLAGPVVKLFRQARGVFPAGPCETFYAGSVAPPR